jgi:hypothetical protein
MRFLCVAWGTTFTGSGQDNAFSESCLPTLHAANATSREHRRKWQHSRSCGVSVCWVRINGQCFGSPDKWTSGGRAQTARRTRLKSGHVILGERRLSSPALIPQLAAPIDAIDKRTPKIFSLCERLRLLPPCTRIFQRCRDIAALSRISRCASTNDESSLWTVTINP